MRILAKAFGSAALSLSVLALFRPACAVDGVIEINQAKALAGGVTTGDFVGFPVSINASGSYRLTSDLIAAANNDGIVVGADDVTIDLNGFNIIGTAGIIAEGIGLSSRKNIEIRNGTIRGFTRDGIFSNAFTQYVGLIGLRLIGNTSYGADLEGPANTVDGCTALNNLASGIRVFDGSLVTNSVARGNTFFGLILAGAGVAGRILAIAIAAFATSARALAVTPLVQIRFSPDITASLDTATVNDEDVGIDNLTGTVTLQSIGAIPALADLDGYAVRANGDQLLSFDTTVTLPGGMTAGPADVVRYDGVNYTIEFASAPIGIPNGVNVDAVAVHGSSLLLSFDVSFDLNGVHFDDEDLALFDGALFTMFFDGSAAGIGTDLDLDAADYIECNDHLLLPFDGSGTISGVAFDDEDVLEFDRVSSWEKVYDGSVQHPGWSAADLDAIHATVDPGPGPPAVFGQTVQADADKATIRWATPVAFKVVRGSFVASTNIGAYTVSLTSAGTGTSTADVSTPAAGSGYWYLVKRGGGIQSSWQSALGAEPGRDLSIP